MAGQRLNLSQASTVCKQPFIHILLKRYEQNMNKGPSANRWTLLHAKLAADHESVKALFRSQIYQ